MRRTMRRRHFARLSVVHRGGAAGLTPGVAECAVRRARRSWIPVHLTDGGRLRLLVRQKLDSPPARSRSLGAGGSRGQVRRRRFEQRHDVDAAGLQHRAFGQRDIVQLQFAMRSATVVRGPGKKLARTR